VGNPEEGVWSRGDPPSYWRFRSPSLSSSRCQVSRVSTGPLRAPRGSSPAPCRSRSDYFSPRHATFLGLDWQRSSRRLEALHLKVIRLSAYWDQVDSEGYGQLDWLLNESQASGQPVVLSVGMKGEGWPEFYIPSEFHPDHR